MYQAIVLSKGSEQNIILNFQIVHFFSVDKSLDFLLDLSLEAWSPGSICSHLVTMRPSMLAWTELTGGTERNCVLNPDPLS